MAGTEVGFVTAGGFRIHVVARAVALALAYLAFFAPAQAVVVEPDRLYPAGTRLEAPDLGVAFTVPSGWQGAWPRGSEVFVLQPEGDPQTTILAMGEEASKAEIAAMMAAPIDLGGGISLHPSGAVTERGKALSGRYEVRGGQAPMVAYAEALAGPSGIAVAYVLIGAPGSIARHEGAVKTLIDGTALGAPAGGTADSAPSSGAASASGDRWDTYLEGKYIVRYYTRTGYTDEEHLWLCSDGSFQRRGAAGGFGGGASGAFQSDGVGTWSATGAGENGTLNLRYGDGSTATYQLRWDYENNHLYVDGKRWLHGDNEVCD